MQPLIEVQNLSFQFQKQKKSILDQIDLSFFEGEITALVGNSGSGKSTFGKLLIGLLSPTEGKILYRGKAIKKMYGEEKKEFQKNCQLIFQHPSSSLNPKLPIFTTLQEPLKIHSIPYFQRKKRILDVLKKIGLKKEHLFYLPKELSGGMQQRVAIARALLLEPQFLICDEITSSLDFVVQKQIIELLKKLQKEENLTILLITHDLTLAYSLADRILILKQGKIMSHPNFCKKELEENQTPIS